MLKFPTVYDPHISSDTQMLILLDLVEFICKRLEVHIFTLNFDVGA